MTLIGVHLTMYLVHPTTMCVHHASQINHGCCCHFRRKKYVRDTESRYWEHMTPACMTEESDAENAEKIVTHQLLWRSECEFVSVYVCVCMYVCVCVHVFVHVCIRIRK